jgi:hypothetical protein
MLQRYVPYFSTMDKKELINLIDNIVTPIGLIRKGNNWRCENDELIKVINLQKSSYGNMFYINYGFDLKGLEYDGTSMHIFRGLSASDNNNALLLDLSNNLGDSYRVSALKLILSTVLAKELSSINSIADIVNFLKSRPNNNDVPLKVKDFLGIS